jgi:flagellar biosynthesis GTPase FlhF
VEEFKAGAAMSISHYPDQQLVKANISKVDLMEIIRVAGKVAEIQVLQEMGGSEEIFVFTDAHLYISTGATIAEKEYERGISAGGKLTAFGKTAEFDLSIGAAGLDLQAFIDNFSLGPLVVTSASGDPRASMIIQMTKDEQVIKVDGKVTCFGIGLVALVDIQMGTETPSFNAYLAVQFTEAFRISLCATVDDFHDIKDLATKGLLFEGLVEGDLFEAICKSITHMLKNLEELGTQGIESLQNLITANITQKKIEMEELAEKVREAEKKVDARRRNRQEAKEKEEKKRKEAEDGIKRLRDNLDKETRKRDQVQKELEEKVTKARLNKESLVERKRKEYDDKLKDAKREEEDNRKRLNDLQQRQQTKYGTDFLKKVDIAKGAWYEKQAAEKASWEGVQWVYWKKCDASL